jgi:hypothetical protein
MFHFIVSDWLRENMKTKITAIICLTLSLSLNAKIYKREVGTCFPTNTSNFGMYDKSSNGLSEIQFNQVLDTVQTIMGPEIKKRLNKNLIIDRLWPDSTVDAYATRDDDNNPVIVINGGLARHPRMTKDGFLLLVCHELGHHLGGAPKILRGNSGLRSWSSAEGQADYYAVTKCLPLLFQTGNENNNIDTENSGIALSKCSDDICGRIVLSGLTVSQVIASLVKGMPEPSLLLQDSTKVERTNYNHPNPQCRLDTFSSGANCDSGIEIPFDPTDPRIGACIKDKGARPICWFREKDFTSAGF